MGKSNPSAKSQSRRQAFVYVVCGDQHVERVNTSLKFLKKFTQKEIIVLGSRISAPLNHDQVIHVPDQKDFSDHQMSILMKTGIHRYLPNSRLLGCYLDTDVIAVNEDVDSIFKQSKGPFAFAQDHYRLPTFSRYAVNCGCAESQCGHLVQAIQDKFKVEVKDPGWAHWNGGVFLFSEEAKPFFDLWTKYTLEIFQDPYWKTRDQGTLVAAAWRLGLQAAPTLARKYNFIVDCFEGTPLRHRERVKDHLLKTQETYSLAGGGDKPRPSLIHFINGGTQRRGWKNWDEAQKLLDEKTQTTKTVPVVSKPAPLTPDNRIVHGLWIGKSLSKLELLTIHSFLKHGHEFHLWLYDPLETPLPSAVVIEDANRIIPREKIIRKKENDPETGVGKGSVSAPFSDLFRYKLLYEKGGYWVDMDVTCLKPFNFPGEYVFRTHRVGVVGSILKCPPRSRLMKMTYEEVAREANEETPWLAPNRILSRNVKKLQLDRFILPNICNEDKWGDIVLPFIEKDVPIPKEWFGIHWINEMFRTLKRDRGVYRGKRYVQQIPDKDSVPAETTLGRLYAQYGLAENAQAEAAVVPPPPKAVAPEIPPPFMTPAKRQPIAPDIFRSTHFNVLLPSLAMGGAERSVVETLQGLSKIPATAKLFVMNDVKPAYDCEGIAHTKVSRLQGMDLETKLRTVAFETLASPTPVIFTHMVHAQHLRPLWRLGVFTIPVIQNSRPSWQDEPSAFNDPQVPFVVAVSEDVAEQLRAVGCPKPVIALRHELQRWFTAEELQAQRRKIRELHAVPDNTLLIGMVGEFKSQKAYTRAVRVLAEIRRHQNAKLMILGGWDHHWGNGRAAFTAACKQALDLGVMPDLLTPGPVKDVGPYYAAFDVFLNTSIYEGLSVAALEAVNAGCLIVSADAGGNRECLPPDAVIVRDSSDISAYVSGIAQVLSKGHRLVPTPPPDLDLVPRLWSMLGQYGVSDLFPENQNKDGVLFLSDNLNLGGAPRSLVNLLRGLPRGERTWLGVLHSINHQAFLEELESAGVPVFSLRSATSYLDHVEQILAMVRRTGAGTVVFWNVNARVKLLLAKVLAQVRIKLIDVSPGPWLFEDMNQQADFQRRITFNAAEYFGRLDHFVSKYKGGNPPGLRLPARKLSVIPNGVPPMAGNAKAGKHLKRGKEREFLIGTCCRIMPSKRIDYFVAMLAELNPLLPGVKMILVGAAHPQYEDYWWSIQKLIRELGVDNLHFAGPQTDVASYLRQFEVFVMLGTDHGCPNASLEAMSAGLPIVAARHGGTREQVTPGVNGFLVSDENPKEMARRVRTLLLNPQMRRKFGQAGRKIVNQKFSMDLMVKRYSQLLGIEKKGKKNRPRKGGAFQGLLKESIKPLPNP